MGSTSQLPIVLLASWPDSKACKNVETIVTKAQQTGQSAEEIFGSQLPAINAALASDYGVQAINAAYVTEINNRITNVNDIVDNYITNPSAKPFLDTDLGKVTLIDYDNHFGLTATGDKAKLVNYINGEHVSLNNGASTAFPFCEMIAISQCATEPISNQLNTRK